LAPDLAKKSSNLRRQFFSSIEQPSLYVHKLAYVPKFAVVSKKKKYPILNTAFSF
jgi:hypothetical protein